MIRARAEGPVEADMACPTTRKVMSEAAFQAEAVASDMIAAPVNPSRYMRRCP